jgi:hypothetical protein
MLYTIKISFISLLLAFIVLEISPVTDFITKPTSPLPSPPVSSSVYPRKKINAAFMSRNDIKDDINDVERL